MPVIMTPDYFRAAHKKERRHRLGVSLYSGLSVPLAIGF